MKTVYYKNHIKDIRIILVYLLWSYLEARVRTQALNNHCLIFLFFTRRKLNTLMSNILMKGNF